MSNPSRSSAFECPPIQSTFHFFRLKHLDWLQNSRLKRPLAQNRFQPVEEATEAVKKICSAGATRVEVVVTEADRSENGNDVSDTLEVTFPISESERVLSVIRSLEPDNFGEEGDYPEDESPIQTETLWWDLALRGRGKDAISQISLVTRGYPQTEWSYLVWFSYSSRRRHGSDR